MHIKPGDQQLVAKAVPLLLQSLTEERPMVRAEVARTLGELGDCVEAGAAAAAEGCERRRLIAGSCGGRSSRRANQAAKSPDAGKTPPAPPAPPKRPTPGGKPAVPAPAPPGASAVSPKPPLPTGK